MKILILLSLMLAMTALLGARVWTNTLGQSFEGELVEFDGESARIKRVADGLEFNVNLADFSEADQTYLSGMKDEEGDDEPAPAIPTTQEELQLWLSGTEWLVEVTTPKGLINHVVYRFDEGAVLFKENDGSWHELLVGYTALSEREFEYSMKPYRVTANSDLTSFSGVGADESALPVSARFLGRFESDRKVTSLEAYGKTPSEREGGLGEKLSGTKWNITSNASNKPFYTIYFINEAYFWEAGALRATAYRVVNDRSIAFSLFALKFNSDLTEFEGVGGKIKSEERGYADKILKGELEGYYNPEIFASKIADDEFVSSIPEEFPSVPFKVRGGGRYSEEELRAVFGETLSIRQHQVNEELYVIRFKQYGIWQGGSMNALKASGKYEPIAIELNRKNASYAQTKAGLEKFLGLTIKDYENKDNLVIASVSVSGIKSVVFKIDLASGEVGRTIPEDALLHGDVTVRFER